MGILKKFVLSQQWLTNLVMHFRKMHLKRKLNIRYEKSSFIGYSVVCEGDNGFGQNTTVASCHIGFASYVAANSHLQKTKIGRFSSIGPNVNCIFGKHPSSVFASTHPSFFSKTPPVNLKLTERQLFTEFAEPKDEGKKYSIIVGNDVWIGANVSLMDGVSIGDGAIVAANALVTKDVPPYTIVGGVPSKPIKSRFDKEDIKFLLDLKWWDKPLAWIKENAPHFENIEQLKKKVGEK